ncbi:MAG: sulfurtransferase TusA family protein [Elusimicrobiales bacterium]|nr:sulfurtransferase TusA family protein [Elusimicrobiales bacterium]
MAREQLDLRGVPCPANSARALMRLETLAPGDELEITVDDGEPALNVPASLEGEGHAVTRKIRAGACWTITARKG